MLEDMPVGNPVYTTEKNLDNIKTNKMETPGLEPELSP